MSLNGSGIRDIARVLKISPTTVIEEIKKETELSAVNTVLLRQLNSQEVVVELRQHIEFIEEAECDERWSFVGSKAQQRWLWYAIDHATGKSLAYVLGSRKDPLHVRIV